MLSSRERLIETINHRQPDRLCVDLGAGGQTGMGVLAVDRLRHALFNDPDYKVKVTEPYQMLGEIDMDLIRKLELDVVGVPSHSTLFGFPNENWKPFTMQDGTEVQVPGDFNHTIDENGAILMYPEGDISSPPCAKMPGESYFFDALPRFQEIIDEENLDPGKNTEEFSLLSEKEIGFYDTEISLIYDSTSLGIYFTLPGAGFGDIALVPATWMANPKGIRDLQEWYISLIMRTDFIKAVFKKQCEFALENIEKLAPILKDRVQVVFVSGTDFGTQSGLFSSAESYRELFKPYHIEINRKIHELTGCKTFIHSCGAIRELIPDFIDAGFDILNPVQISASNMDPAELKKEFGKDIVFWGGGIDTQHTLPFGTPDEVYREVLHNIEIFEENGGFVFNSVHNIQSNVPTENILSMFRALNDARGIN